MVLDYRRLNSIINSLSTTNTRNKKNGKCARLTVKHPSKVIYFLFFAAIVSSDCEIKCRVLSVVLYRIAYCPRFLGGCDV